MAACCPETPDIGGIYKTLSQRLLDFGHKVYADCVSQNRVIMWVFSFYDGLSKCKVCKHSMQAMYDWFRSHGLFDNPAREVRIVIEDEPTTDPIYTEMHLNSLPVHIFTDGNGRVIDMLFDFPDAAWLDKYILPYIQEDTRLI